MYIFKCKMCGSTIKYEQGKTVCVCNSCGTEQTLPCFDRDRWVNMYDRANHFRQNNEFDKAAAIYEQILTENKTDAEVYWSLVLCQYGIEYVEDPVTRKRVPTINRTQFTSIFADDNYKSAIKYADSYQRELYEKEAKAINDIQKDILAISQKEEPFDVFICYKETDNNGRRTPDSVLANELYYLFKQEGFKVFFARITLEDKLGSTYEPYIFAALNSAKVMVVLGTKPEHFNAVWVKNEWSRYLSLVKKSCGKKLLIPAYRDMNPYDLPEEFSHLQALDMSKLGFMQDLIRGIKKITNVDESKDTVKETVVICTNNPNVSSLLERVFLFLEDGKWQDADIYCEKVLDIDPKNAEAYLGKLMANLQVRSRKQLAYCQDPFDNNENYCKILRFGNEKLEVEMRSYISHINERNENARLTSIYNSAVSAMNSANTESEYKAAADTFKTILHFKDADALVRQCLDRAEVCRKNAIYISAYNEQLKKSMAGYECAIRLYLSISGWKDADQQINFCQLQIEGIKTKEAMDLAERKRQAEQKRIAAEKAKKRRIMFFAIVIPLIIVGSIVFGVVTTVIMPKEQLNKITHLLDSGDYETAYALLEEIGNSDDIVSWKYDKAVAYINSNNYGAAYALLNGLEYNDSNDMRKMIENSEGWMRICPVGKTFFFGSYEQDNNSSNGKEDIEWLVLAKEDTKALVISQYALDCQPYNMSNTSVTWENCSLRKWLNETFINATFNSEEQNRLVNSQVTADKNPSFNTSPGNTTTDKVFLLSITEVNKYFSSDYVRECQGTEYCYAQGAYTASNSCTCWWLRSPSAQDDCVVIINAGGRVIEHGPDFNDSDYAVRPALWINLES